MKSICFYDILAPWIVVYDWGSFMLEQVVFFTILVSPFFIPFLRKLKFGQSIRAEGPQAHLQKSGTPTMGGIVIVIAMVITALLMVWRVEQPSTDMLLLVFATVAFGLIGFLDDFIKVVLKRNLGLTSLQKLIGQLLVALICYGIVVYFGYSTTIGFQALGLEIDLKLLYGGFLVVYFIAVTNAVNLTDGLDGLLSGTAAIAFGAFAILAWLQENYEVAIFCMAAVGALLGFLVFNAHPAKVFMGDTGSLALGGALGAVALILNHELLLMIIGGVFVIEALSVILQVVSFKLTGKRIFKMSPIHHHYELSGWSEWRVVTTFWLVAFLFAALGIYMEMFL